MGLYPRSSLILGLLYVVLTHSNIAARGDTLLDVDAFTSRTLSQEQDLFDADEALVAAADIASRVPNVCKVVTGNTTNECASTCEVCASTAAPANRRPCRCCKAGHFPSEGSPARCTQCPVGTFAAAGAARCRPCPGRTTTIGKGRSACNACKAGNELVVRNNRNTCRPCAAGFFTRAAIPFDRPATCQACPRGRTTDGTDRTRCGACMAGHAGATCRICARGTYSTGGLANRDNKCIACPAGATTDGPGATSAAACTGGNVPTPSPAPITSATVNIRISGGCNNSVTDALVAAIRDEVTAQTPEADRASVKVTLGSCSAVTGQRRFLLQSSAGSLITIIVERTGASSDLVTVLQSSALNQKLQETTRQLDRTLVGVDVKPTDAAPSPSPSVSPSPRPTSPSPSPVRSPAPGTPPILEPPTPVTPPPPATRQTCAQSGHVCSSGTLKSNVDIPIGQASDGLCCQPEAVPEVVLDVTLTEPCTNDIAEGIQASMLNVATGNLPAEQRSLIRVSAECAANNRRRALLQNSNRVEVTIGASSDVTTNAQQVDRTALVAQAIGIDTTGATTEQVQQQLQQLTNSDSSAADALTNTVTRAVEEAGATVNTISTPEVKSVANCFAPDFPNLRNVDWANTCNNAAPGSQCTGTCTGGTAGLITTTCLTTGSWNGTTGSCQTVVTVLPCNTTTPANVSNANAWPDCANATTCVATCQTNFIGEVKSLCNPVNGQWGTPSGECRAITCPAAPTSNITDRVAAWRSSCPRLTAGATCDAICLGQGTPPSATCTVVNGTGVWGDPTTGNCTATFVDGATCADTNGPAGAGRPRLTCNPNRDVDEARLNTEINGDTQAVAEGKCCVNVYAGGSTCANAITTAGSQGSRLSCQGLVERANFNTISIANIPVAGRRALNACCQNGTFCSSFNCSNVDTRLQANPDANGAVCVNGTCTADLCCQARSSCGNAAPSGGSWTCPSGYQLVDNPSFTFLRNNDNKDNICCRWIPVCGNVNGPADGRFTCGAETRYKDNVDQTQNPSNATCCEPLTCGRSNAAGDNFVCNQGFRFNTASVNETGPTNGKCCSWISTCQNVIGPGEAAFICPEEERLVANATNVTTVSAATCCVNIDTCLPNEFTQWDSTGDVDTCLVVQPTCEGKYSLTVKDSNNNTVGCAEPAGTGANQTCPSGLWTYLNSANGIVECRVGIASCSTAGFTRSVKNETGSVLPVCVPNTGKCPSRYLTFWSNTSVECRDATSCPASGDFGLTVREGANGTESIGCATQVNSTCPGELWTYVTLGDAIHDCRFGINECTSNRFTRSVKTSSGTPAPACAEPTAAGECPARYRTFWGANSAIDCRPRDTACGAPFSAEVKAGDAHNEAVVIGCVTPTANTSTTPSICPATFTTFYKSDGGIQDCRVRFTTCPNDTYTLQVKRDNLTDVAGCAAPTTTTSTTAKCPGLLWTFVTSTSTVGECRFGISACPASGSFSRQVREDDGITARRECAQPQQSGGCPDRFNTFWGNNSVIFCQGTSAPCTGDNKVVATGTADARDTTIGCATPVAATETRPSLCPAPLVSYVKADGGIEDCRLGTFNSCGGTTYNEPIRSGNQTAIIGCAALSNSACPTGFWMYVASTDAVEECRVDITACPSDGRFTREVRNDAGTTPEKACVEPGSTPNELCPARYSTFWASNTLIYCRRSTAGCSGSNKVVGTGSGNTPTAVGCATPLAASGPRPSLCPTPLKTFIGSDGSIADCRLDVSACNSALTYNEAIMDGTGFVGCAATGTNNAICPTGLWSFINDDGSVQDCRMAVSSCDSQGAYTKRVNDADNNPMDICAQPRSSESNICPVRFKTFWSKTGTITCRASDTQCGALKSVGKGTGDTPTSTIGCAEPTDAIASVPSMCPGVLATFVQAGNAGILDCRLETIEDNTCAGSYPEVIKNAAGNNIGCAATTGTPLVCPVGYWTMVASDNAVGACQVGITLCSQASPFIREVKTADLVTPAAGAARACAQPQDAAANTLCPSRYSTYWEGGTTISCIPELSGVCPTTNTNMRNVRTGAADATGTTNLVGCAVTTPVSGPTPASCPGSLLSFITNTGAIHDCRVGVSTCSGATYSNPIKNGHSTSEATIGCAQHDSGKCPTNYVTFFANTATHGVEGAVGECRIGATQCQPPGGTYTLEVRSATTGNREGCAAPSFGRCPGSVASNVRSIWTSANTIECQARNDCPNTGQTQVVLEGATGNTEIGCTATTNNPEPRRCTAPLLAFYDSNGDFVSCRFVHPTAACPTGVRLIKNTAQTLIGCSESGTATCPENTDPNTIPDPDECTERAPTG